MKQFLGRDLLGDPIIRNARSSYSGRGGMSGHKRPNEGESDEWLTPLDLIEDLAPPQGFQVDPCCPRWMPWSTARTMFTAEHGAVNTEHPTFLVGDGRDIDYWTGTVWLNPPYSEIETWLPLAAEFDDALSLVFANTETQWFQRLVFERATAILFLEGRLYFRHPDGTKSDANAGGPSCLVAYGLNALHLLQTTERRGRLVQL